MSNTIIYIGGKSGGHILPCLTLAGKEQDTNKTQIIFIAADTQLDHSIVNTHSFSKKKIFLPFYSVKITIGNICAFLYSLIICTYTLISYRPKKIVSSGGALSLPLCIVGYIARVPIELYELNAIPGRAILFLSRFATTIFICFSQTAKYFPQKKTMVTHYPVRYSNKDIVSKEHACVQLNLLPNKITILIIGGSQGSQFLNSIVAENKIFFMLYPDIQIIHLVGNNDPEYFKKIYTKAGIKHFVTTYTDNMANIYCAADIVISRAGAGTLAELLFFKRQTIIIPLSSTTTSHQIDNAHAYEQEYQELFCTIDEDEIKHDYDVFIRTLDKKLGQQKNTLKQKKDTLSCPLQ